MKYEHPDSSTFGAGGPAAGTPPPHDVQSALDQLLAEPPLDERQIEAAAARVWNRLQVAASTAGTATIAQSQDPAIVSAGSAGFLGSAGSDTADPFLSDIPAYLRGELSSARAMLLEDHVRECVVCRRALQAARFTGGPVTTRTSRAPERRRGLPRWLAAAAVLALVLGAGLLGYRTFGSWGAAGAGMARVETVEGNLYRIAGAASTPVAVGASIRQGEQVRTAKGSRAVLRMVDGSRIEMAERAGLALASARDGNTIELERGRIIVQAAHQRPRHLYVATADCLVSVTGTIFAVNHGTKGSRVSVVDGEVRVQQSGVTQAVNILHPGDQVTTHASVATVPVSQEIAWSRDAARYDGMLAAVTSAGKAIDAQVTRPAVRTSSTLLDLVPAGSLVYVALPNLAANLAQTQQLLDQQLAANPMLQQWWSQTLGSPANEARFHQLIQEVADVGQYLGNEVVVAAGSTSGSGAVASTAAGPPVMFAQALQEVPLRATLTQEIAALNLSAGRQAVVLLDQLPAVGSPTPAGSAAPLLVWVGNGLMVASPSGAQIAAVAANAQAGAVNPFASSSFHARLAQAYNDGAGWLFAADLQQIVAAHRQTSGGGSSFAEASGLYDLQHFVLEHHDSAPGSTLGTETSAALTFSQPRRGVAAWLAAPAPMGSLGFFSSDANLVAAFVVKSPVELLDELLALSPNFAAELSKAEAAHGFNLRDDLAAPLGGEIALGLDGPVLPSPSWELVAEVYDPTHLQQTLTRMVQQANDQLVADGKPGMTLTSTQSGGNTYYTVVSSQPQIEIHYLFTAGYLVAAPTQAQLDHALAQRAAGTSLASSAKLRGLLGQDGQVNVSALFYRNLAPVLGALGSLAGAAGPMGPMGSVGSVGSSGSTSSMGSTAAGVAPHGHHLSAAAGARGLGGLLFGGAQGPSLLYAYAENDRIVFSGHGDAGPMGLNLETLAGFGAILGGMGHAQAGAAPQSAPAPRGGAPAAAPASANTAALSPRPAVAPSRFAYQAAKGRGPW